MTDDITHNLTVVREALEAEGLGVHVKLIDAAIEDVAKLRDQIAGVRKALEPIPINWARPSGATFEEMRENVWKTDLAKQGDAVLIWVNEGDFLHAQIVCGSKEHTLTDDNRKVAPCYPNDPRPIWEQGLSVACAQGKPE